MRNELVILLTALGMQPGSNYRQADPWLSQIIDVENAAIDAYAASPEYLALPAEFKLIPLSKLTLRRDLALLARTHLRINGIGA